MKHSVRSVLLLAPSLMLLSPRPARAELVFFATGRTLSVKSHRLDGESLVLALRAGGEIVCEPSIVIAIRARRSAVSGA